MFFSLIWKKEVKGLEILEIGKFIIFELYIHDVLFYFLLKCNYLVLEVMKIVFVGGVLEFRFCYCQDEFLDVSEDVGILWKKRLLKMYIIYGGVYVLLLIDMKNKVVISCFQFIKVYSF